MKIRKGFIIILLGVICLSVNAQDTSSSYLMSKFKLDMKEIKFYEHPNILNKCEECNFWQKDEKVKDIPMSKYDALLNSKPFQQVLSEYQQLKNVNQEVSEKAYNPLNNITYDVFSNSKNEKIHVLEVQVGHGCGAPIDRYFGLVYIEGIEEPTYIRKRGIEEIFQIEGRDRLFFKVVDYTQVSIEILKSEKSIEGVLYFNAETEGCGC